VQTQASEVVVELADALIKSVGANFTALHVRRGIEESAYGASRHCSTTVESVRDYVTCALERDPLPSRDAHTLLFFSDETNVAWRRSVLAELRRLHKGLRPLDGDAQLAKLSIAAINEVDDFLVYASANQLRHRSQRNLQMRRCGIDTGAVGQCIPRGLPPILP